MIRILSVISLNTHTHRAGELAARVCEKHTHRPRTASPNGLQLELRVRQMSRVRLPLSGKNCGVWLSNKGAECEQKHVFQGH